MPDGTFTPEMTTGTAVPVAIVASGKLNGLALTAMLLTLVTLITDAGPHLLRARVAVAHEPLARLYDTLPLMSFDSQARRFWRRVFFLVRIPGGRRLLGLVARRAGGAR